MNIADILQNKPQKTTSPANERQEIIQKFVDRINLERKGTEFPPVTWLKINNRLAHINSKTFDYPEGELYKFYRMCEESNSGFSKCFFGALKKK